MRKKTRQEFINEVVYINGSKVFVENGEVKTVLSEDIQRKGWMTVEEMEALIIAEIKKIYAMKNGVQNRRQKIQRH